jgi:hypothetical protein
MNDNTISCGTQQKQGSVGQLRRRTYRPRNRRTSKVEQLKRRKYNYKYHKTLKEGVKKKKNHREFMNKKRWGYSNTKRRDIQDTTFGNRTTN